MDIAIGAIIQETDIFSPVKTTLRSFQEGYLLFGEEIIDFHKGKQTELGGVINIASQENINLIPMVATHSLSGGRVTVEAYDFLKQELLHRLAQAGKIDGVLLALHGSMATGDLDDAEGDLLKAVREQIGNNTYLVVTFDFHANVSPRMVKNANALVGYRTCPHVDHQATGERATRIIISLFQERKNPTMAMEKISMLIPYSTTITDPMKRLMDRAREIEKEKGVISVSLFQGQYESGRRELGPSIVVVTENDFPLARQRTVELKEMWWNLKDKFKSSRISLEEAIKRAKSFKKKLIVLSDRGDDPCSGAPGDGTALLRALLENKVKKVVVAAIPDPESIQKAIQIGLGKRITLNIGGKMDNIYNKPLKVTGTVKFISGGRYGCYPPSGMEIDMGKAVLFGTDDIDIILTENRTRGWGPDFLRKFQIEPTRKHVLIIKGCGPKYRELTENIVEVDTPGYFHSSLILEWVKREQIPLSWNYWEQKEKTETWPRPL